MTKKTELVFTSRPVYYGEKRSRLLYEDCLYGNTGLCSAAACRTCKNGYEVTAVVTQPDKPKGRGKTLLPTPVKEEAMKHDIPVYQPLKVRDPEFVETLKNLSRI